MPRIDEGAQKRIRSTKSVLAVIKHHKDAISKHRDALREIMNDLQVIVESADDGLDALGYAIEQLSQFL